jgi:integrase
MGWMPYERLRARAMVLLLRYTGLRISDVATLEKSCIRFGEILVRTTKNGKPVKLPLHSDLKAALDLLPLPRGADLADCPYLFWSGKGTCKAVVRDVTRTLAAVFKASGVEGACSHRFRPTLATEVLEMGGTYEEAADTLGDLEAIIKKHYEVVPAPARADLDADALNLWYICGTRRARVCN